MFGTDARTWAAQPDGTDRTRRAGRAAAVKDVCLARRIPDRLSRWQDGSPAPRNTATRNLSAPTHPELMTLLRHHIKEFNVPAG
jgi:hypothetical protein